jgi:hypothetical protein
MMASNLPRLPRKVMKSPSCASEPCLTIRFLRSASRSSISFAKPSLHELKFEKSRHCRFEGKYKLFSYNSASRVCYDSHLPLRGQVMEADRSVSLCRGIIEASQDLRFVAGPGLQICRRLEVICSCSGWDADYLCDGRKAGAEACHLSALGFGKLGTANVMTVL